MILWVRNRKIEVVVCVFVVFNGEVIGMLNGTDEFEQLEDAASESGVSKEVYLQSMTLDILREIRDLLKSQQEGE